MAKQSLIVKHQQLEEKWAQYEKELSAILSDSSLSKAKREEKLQDLEARRLKNRLYKSRRYNRCSITGRSKGYYRYFGVCRQSLREMAHWGLLPGVKKSSW
jgi:small subunit ribosomal protein S14